MRIRSSQLVLSLCGCLSGILTDDAERQQDALEYLGVTDLITASPEWLDFCYNYPMFLFVSCSGSWFKGRREKLSTSAEYMIGIFKNKLGMYLIEGGNHALDCCFTWHDETIINDPSDWYWMTRCGDLDHVPENLYGVLQKLSILIGTGYGETAAFDNGLHEEYPQWFMEYYANQTEGFTTEFFQMLEFTAAMKTGTTTNSILHNGPISIGIECTDMTNMTYDNFPIEPDPDIDTDIDCHFNLRADYDYTPIAEKYQVPIVIDSPNIVASSKWYKFINVTNNETFWSENTLPDETVAYVYAYYICEHIYDLFFHPFTSSTEEPTSTTEEPTTTTVELTTTTAEPDTTTEEPTTPTTEATTPTTEATTLTTEATTPTTEPTTPTAEPTTPTAEPTTPTTETTTSTTEPTTTTTTPKPVVTTDGGIVPVVPTDKDTTTTIFTTTSGALLPTPDTKLIPKTGADSSNMGIVISATVGSVAFLGAVGILAFLLKGQWRREEVELEEPEVFGSGNYEVKEEEE